MPSVAHRAKVRRAERAVLLQHGNINLVPLVDILTSIVFFSLLTYTGEQLLRLTAYDLMLPPQVITAEQANQTRGNSELLNLLLAVRVEPNRLIVEHSEENGFRQVISGTNEQSLAQLRSVMTQIREKYHQNSDVTVVPNDEVSYDKVVKVLEQLRLANFRGISLASQARGQTAAAGTGGATRTASGGEVTR
jgi:biopolymer transport protein ExbD